jgi:phosphate transport system protein
MDYIKILKNELAAGHSSIGTVISWLMAAKSIERVADLATNIAEDTIYMVAGEIIRHGRG